MVKGECYEYWTLVKTVRTAKGPRQEILATLGKEPGLESRSRHGWEQVADLLEGRTPAPVQGELGHNLSAAPQAQWAQVDLRGVRVERVREFGQVYLALSLWRRLGLHTLLKEIIQPGEEDVPWAWPTGGAATVVAGFDEQRNKGLDIAGKSGDPVLASADGRVVYAGAGLRGYGNLIILKHNNTYLSAYAHNQTLLVKEDQTVRKGQKIAEMGSSDADRVKLHFEIRRQGKPVDPARYLPAR